jgi:hypothetical protein
LSGSTFVEGDLLPLRPSDEESDKRDATEVLKLPEGDDELLDECKPVKVLRGPTRPTKLELEEHEHSHIPFRSWCPHCMRGKSKASGHRSSNGAREKPIVSIDYAFLGVSKGTSREDRIRLESEAVAAGHTPTLVMFDSESRGIYAYAVTRKGYDERLCRQVVNDLDNLGYKDIVLKSDQEPAIINLVEIIKANWNGNAVLENSPVRESEANGAVERAIQTWEGQVRCMKDALEHRLQTEIPPDHAIMTWIVEYAASLMRRSLVSMDGRTPYEKIKGRPSRRSLSVFGERVWYRPSHGRSKTLDYVLEEGIFLGVQDRSDEVLIGTVNGVVKCRDIRRQAEDRRWDKDAVLAICVTPSQPTEGSEDMRVKTYISPGLDDASVPLPPAHDRTGQGSRRVKLLRQDFERAGLTIGCNGCKAMSRRAAGAVNHSEACRARVQADMAKYPDAAARIAQANARIDDDQMIADEVTTTTKKARFLSKTDDDANAKKVKRVRFLDGPDATIPVVDVHARSTSGDTQMQPSSSEPRATAHALEASAQALASSQSAAVSSSSSSNSQQGSQEPHATEHALEAPARSTNDADISMEDQHERMMRRRLSAATAPASVEGEQGMDIDCLTIDGSITRGNTACTDTVDFSTWDFSSLKHRNAASKLLADIKPGLIIGEELKQHNISREDALRNFDSKIKHAEFLSTLYSQQSNRGLYYLHIVFSDSKSSSAGISQMTDLETCPRHQQVRLNNLVISTNSDAVAQSYIAQDKEYTAALIDETSERRKHRARWSDDEDAMEAILELNQCDDDSDDYYEMTAWDDVKDVALDINKVRKARATEMTYVKKRNVYKYASIAHAKSLGQTIIGTRWIDTNKGDATTENYRSRLVAQEFKNKAISALFAATPPLESLRILLAIFTSEVYDVNGAEKPTEGPERIGAKLIDISRAHFYAPAQRDIFIQLPAEDPRHGEPDVCGQLLQSLYGTRDASSNWEREYSRALISGGFVKGIASPCHFWHHGWDVRLLVHGDDFFTVGPMRGLDKFERYMRDTYECKVQTIGMGEKDAKELRILGRAVSIEQGGILYEADQRHVEAVCAALNIAHSNPCTSPSEREAGPKGEASRNRARRLGEPLQARVVNDTEEELDSDGKTAYQSLSARLNFLSMDRADLQFAVKELMRKMSSPTAADLRALKRVARYIVGAPRVAQLFRWQRRPNKLVVYGDSDFAGCQTTRKSTSGGAAMWGLNTLKTWSKTQSVVALSTGEAELGAIVKSSTEALGLKSLLSDFGIWVVLAVKSDASAAIGMVKRQGLGKVRHLAVADLWIQQRRATGEIHYEKTDGLTNPADMMTKSVGGDKISQFLVSLGFQKRGGRHRLTPALADSAYSSDSFGDFGK